MIAINHASLAITKPIAPSPGVDRPVGPSSAAPTERAADTVEISSAGRAMANLLHDSSLRAASINAIKAEIEAGTYETADKLRFVADRLIDILA